MNNTPYTATVGDVLPESASETMVSYGITNINSNDVSTPTPIVHSAQLDEVSSAPEKFTKADVKQLRKNVNRLQTMHHIDTLKKMSHFNISAFFPVK